MELFKIVGKIAVDNSEANKALAETTSQAKDTARAIDDAGESSGSSGGKFSKAMGKIGSAAVKVGKVAAVGIGAAATAVSGLVAKSVTSYADYEQLVGGVETLFKDSAGTVLKYAENAYKTAGMSANAYMETVTSFSASLLQSLDGDTAKAAEKANLAITDMSDNANKMGTDIGMIQNAYQGFAKQNYTMLDNLKLGYGGTKEEMERLLADAEKLSGQKFDISSYADVVDAIHVIQTEMGITGTTAKEASSTISGSIASMKASWSNLMTALADENADFGAYVDNFVNSVGTVAENLLPRIEIALGGVVQLIDKLAPVIIGKIPELLSSLLPSVINAATGLINAIVEILPGLIDVIVASLPMFIEGIQKIFTGIVEALPVLMQSIMSALPTLLPLLINALVNMIVTLCSNFAAIIQPIIDNLPAIIISIVNALMQNLPALINGCIQLVVALVAALPKIILALLNALPDVIISIVNGLLGALPTLIEGVGQIVTSVVAAVWEFLSGFPQAVANYTTKMWNNLGNIISGVWNAIKTAISTYINTIKTNISTTWNGIKSTISNVVNGIKTTISSVFNSVKNTVGNIFDSIKEKMEKPIQKARDTIRGIVDKIKGFFSGMKISFPSIKLPHFSIKPSGWKIGDLLKGSIPKLAIDWYAKAMRNPMIMTEPTVFGYNAETGNLQAGGEAGPEVVSGASTLMNMIQAAVAEQNSNLAFYLQRIIEILAAYFPQILDEMGKPISWNPVTAANAMAVPMNQALGKLTSNKERGR